MLVSYIYFDFTIFTLMSTSHTYLSLKYMFLTPLQSDYLNICFVIWYQKYLLIMLFKLEECLNHLFVNSFECNYINVSIVFLRPWYLNDAIQKCFKKFMFF